MDAIKNVVNVTPGAPTAAVTATTVPGQPSTTFDAALTHALNHAQASASGSVRPMGLAGDVQPTVRGTDAAPARHPGASHSDLQERALALLSRRQALIAANIANADTPNYKAVDIDVAEALRMGYSPENAPIQYRVPSQPSLDGNTVEMDAERAKFAENTIRYQFALDRVSGHYKMMIELLRNLTP